MRLLAATLGLITLVLALAATLLLASRQEARPLPPAPGPGHGEIMANLDLHGLNPAAVQERLAWMAADGIHYVRLRLPWDAVEPEPHAYNWAPLQAAVAATRQHEQRLVLLLDGAPAWAVKPADRDNRLAPPHDVRDFGRFAAAVAARFGPDIWAYQIWDEPNIAPHWGVAGADPRAYFHLLREAASSIRGVDPQATIVLAALAPTTAADGANLSDLVYLDQLYQLGAGEFFDVAAAAGYGFDDPPEAEPAPEHLNFRRPELVHQVMARHGEAAKPLWLTSWGWWAPPAGSDAVDSPWGAVQPELLPEYVTRALHLARSRWPWAGPLAWVQYAAASGGDPLRLGFVQRGEQGDLSPAGAALRLDAPQRDVLGTGSHPIDHPAISAPPEWWRLGPAGADPTGSGAHLSLTFEGRTAALEIQRGLYWGVFRVWIDGEPAPLLPRDEHGEPYLILFDPDNPVVIVPLARDLPPGPHTLRLAATGGWGQWPLRRVIVDHEPWPQPWSPWPLAAVLSLAVVFIGWWVVRSGQWAVGSSQWPVFSGQWEGVRDRWTRVSGRWAWPWLGENVQFGVALVLLLAFYLAPGMALSLLCLALLLALLALRPDFVPALVLVTLPFYLRPKFIGSAGVPVHELLVWAGAGLWLARRLLAALAARTPKTSNPPPATRHLPRATYHLPFATLHLPVFIFVFAGLFAALDAVRPGPAVYELRTVFVTPALFYLLLIRGQPGRPLNLALLSHGLILGALLLSGLGLYQFFSGGAALVEGVPRVRALFGSPNNLALYLGRVLPLLLALGLTGAGPSKAINWWLRASLVMVGAVAFLTFSKGLLLISLPTSLLLLALFVPRLRRPLLILAIVGLLALLPFAGTPRFADLTNIQSGTTFVRLRLWESAWQMWLDHPWLGVGPDNFLYEYRSVYARPSAWEELNLSHPHNLFLDLLTRLGVFGFLAGLWLLAVTLYKGFRLLPATLSPYCLGLFVGLVAGLAHGMIDNSFFLVDLSTLTMLVVAMVQRRCEGA